MKIRYSKNAMKFLNKLDKKSVLRIVAGIEGLTLKPPAGDIKVMQGLKDGTGKTAIEKYLGSGLIRGIGPSTAKLIVRHFGENALEILLVLDIGNRGDIYK